MTWNYRVVKRVWYPDTDAKTITYAIHEAYYDDNNLVHSITQEPVEIETDDIDSIKQILKWMTKCLEKPILDYDNIPEPGAKYLTIEEPL
jgi:uncharacterized protein YegL